MPPLPLLLQCPSYQQEKKENEEDKGGGGKELLKLTRAEQRMSPCKRKATERVTMMMLVEEFIEPKKEIISSWLGSGRCIAPTPFPSPVSFLLKKKEKKETEAEQGGGGKSC